MDNETNYYCRCLTREVNEPFCMGQPKTIRFIKKCDQNTETNFSIYSGKVTLG